MKKYDFVKNDFPIFANFHPIPTMILPLNGIFDRLTHRAYNDIEIPAIPPGSSLEQVTAGAFGDQGENLISKGYTGEWVYVERHQKL